MKAHLEHWDAKKYRVTKDYGNTSQFVGLVNSRPRPVLHGGPGTTAHAEG